MLVVIVLSAQLVPISGTYADTAFPPKGVSPELWNAFKEVTNVNIEAADRNIKWSTNPYFYLMGTPTAEDNNIFQGTIGQIQKYCRNVGPFVTTRQTDKGVTFNYLPANKFNTVINTVPAGTTSSYAYYLYYPNQGLANFTTVISTELSQQERNRTTQYRILQAMGLLNSTKNLSANIFSWDLNSDRITEASELDKQIIRLYCSTYARSWNTAQQTLDQINLAWTKSPRTAYLPLNIKVGEYKNQLNFLFDFDPDQILEYQVTGINYVIRDSKGEVAKSGIIDVSQNVFQTFQVVLSDIKDKSRYTIDAVPVNSFGNGSLSTARGTAGTQPAPKESSSTSPGDTSAEATDATNAAFDATNAAKEAIEAFQAAKVDCISVSSDFNREEQDLFDSTNLVSACEGLNDRAATLRSKILALDPEKAKTTEQANLITTTANQYAENADALVAEILDIADSLTATEELLTEIIILLEPLNEIDTTVLEPWSSLLERIQLLPVGTQSAIKKSQSYKLATNYVLQAKKISQLLDDQLEVLAEISDPIEVNSVIQGLAKITVSTSQIAAFKKNLIAIKKLVPSKVCQRGSVTNLPSKTGKCAKGFELISTS